MTTTEVSKLLATSARTSRALSRVIEKGLRVEVVKRVVKETGISLEGLSSLLGIVEKTLRRWLAEPGKRLEPAVGDRLYRVAAAYLHAVDVLGSADEARSWLNLPQTGLGGDIPFKALRTEIGAREVENLLGRIEHGVMT